MHFFVPYYSGIRYTGNALDVLEGDEFKILDTGIPCHGQWSHLSVLIKSSILHPYPSACSTCYVHYYYDMLVFMDQNADAY